VACVVENGKKDIDQKLRVDIGSIWKFLKDKNDQVIEFEVTFEISGQAEFIYDSRRIRYP
jgi:hypothetical protein